MPGEEPVEMLGTAGFDFVLIDCEHGPADVADLRRHIAAAQVHGMAVLVRVGADEPALALRALDHGAAGIVVPHVDGPRDAERAVRAVRHPPLGDRGFATYGRAGGYGTVPAAEHLRRAEADVLLIVMAESEQGCDRAKEVLAVPGVDGVLVGPADLAVSMGSPAGRTAPGCAPRWTGCTGRPPQRAGSGWTSPAALQRCGRPTPPAPTWSWST
ncbi:HpcH/HpaI aldolase/citrate lyase family protein [Nocardiopsis composta]